MYYFLSNVNNLESPTGSTFDTVGQTISVIFVLIFTIGMIYFFAYLAKKFKFGSSAFANNNINIIEYKNIGNNNNLILASIGSKYILLGSSKDKVNLICELKEDELDLSKTENKFENINFIDVLNKKLKNENGTKSENGGKNLEQ